MRERYAELVALSELRSETTHLGLSYHPEKSRNIIVRNG
jgi:hypothetical protein